MSDTYWEYPDFDCVFLDNYWKYRYTKSNKLSCTWGSIWNFRIASYDQLKPLVIYEEVIATGFIHPPPSCIIWKYIISTTVLKRMFREYMIRKHDKNRINTKVGEFQNNIGWDQSLRIVIVSIILMAQVVSECSRTINKDKKYCTYYYDREIPY